MTTSRMYHCTESVAPLKMRTVTPVLLTDTKLMELMP